MIEYDPSSLCWICGIRGSVFPKGCMWAIPSAAFAVLLRTFWDSDDANPTLDLAGADTIWSGYTFVLGFLVVFRNSQAYSRFWEGATLIQQTRGEWFNCVSSCFAFSTQNPEKKSDVEKFHKLLVHLMSVLFCQALQQVCDLEDDVFEIINLDCLEQERVAFLAGTSDRCEVVLQWIQRLIVDATNQGLIEVAPPILSRAYQELSRGMVNLTNVRKIKDVPFPFPYAQMIAVMLWIHVIMTPVIAAHYISSPIWAGVMTFLVTGAFWSLVYIAQEIDHPFGEDPNDLNIAELMQNMNTSLLTLLQPIAQTTPATCKGNVSLVRSDAVIIGTAEADHRLQSWRAKRTIFRGSTVAARDSRVRRLSDVQVSFPAHVKVEDADDQPFTSGPSERNGPEDEDLDEHGQWEVQSDPGPPQQQRCGVSRQGLHSHVSASQAYKQSFVTSSDPAMLFLGGDGEFAECVKDLVPRETGIMPPGTARPHAPSGSGGCTPSSIRAQRPLSSRDESDAVYSSVEHRLI